MSKEINKTWLNFSLLILIGLVSGLLGCWIYLSFFNPGQAYWADNLLSANNQSGLIISNAKKVVVEQDNKVAETVNSLQANLAGIFSKQTQGNYDLTKPQGQALIITSDGWLLTNFNFKSTNLAGFVVINSNKEIYELDQIVKDQLSGLAFIHVQEAKDLPVSRLAQASQLQSGQLVVGVNWQGPMWLSAISQINHQLTKSSQDLTSVSLTTPPLADYPNLIIVNLSGEVVGLINQTGQIKTADYFIAMVNNLLAGRSLQTPYLGLVYQNLAYLAETQPKQGARLTVIKTNSPAARAGLRINDVITAIDGVYLNEKNDLADLLLTYASHSKIMVSYSRLDKNETVEVVLE